MVASHGGEVADTYTSCPPMLRIACGVAGGMNTSVPGPTSHASAPATIWPRPCTIRWACSCAGWACRACWLPGWHSTQVTLSWREPNCPAISSRRETRPPPRPLRGLPASVWTFMATLQAGGAGVAMLGRGVGAVSDVVDVVGHRPGPHVVQVRVALDQAPGVPRWPAPPALPD